MEKQKIEIEVVIPKELEGKRFKSTNEFRQVKFGEYFIEIEFREVCLWNSEKQNSLMDYFILEELK
jgi:hypothetical protein